MSFADRLLTVEDTIAHRIFRDVAVPVLIGRKSRTADFKPPMVWVFPEESPVNSMAMGFRESWSLSYWCIGLVREVRDIEAGRRQAMVLAITASGSLFRDDVGVPDRSLGGIAESVSRVAWSPADVRVMDTDESLIGAAVRVTVNLLTAEVC